MQYPYRRNPYRDRAPEPDEDQLLCDAVARCCVQAALQLRPLLAECDPAMECDLRRLTPPPHALDLAMWFKADPERQGPRLVARVSAWAPSHILVRCHYSAGDIDTVGLEKMLSQDPSDVPACTAVLQETFLRCRDDYLRRAEIWHRTGRLH